MNPKKKSFSLFMDCGRKVQFVSESEAAARLKVIGAGDTLQVYKCPHCRGYHFRKRRKRNRTKKEKIK